MFTIPTMIVPTLNGQDRINFLFNSFDYPIDQVVIINNGDEFVNNPRSQMVSRVDVIELPSNLGVAASWNLGIKVTPFSSWWLIVNDDVTFPPKALARFNDHMNEFGAIGLSAVTAPWCAFGISEHVVRSVGLFDEAFYPAYFEDTDYARRAREIMGDDIIYDTGIVVNHSNSSTISGGFTDHNNRTFHANHKTFEDKVSLNLFEPLGWQIDIRRANDWGI